MRSFRRAAAALAGVFRRPRSERNARSSGSALCAARALAAGLPVAAALAFAVPQAAPAQTNVNLVSNSGQTPVVDNYGTPRDYAQKFTTGSFAVGYTLTRVDIDLDVGSGSQGLPDYHLDIKAVNASGNPGDNLVTMTAAAALSTGLRRYNAPGGGLRLAANTDYFVVFRASAWGGRRLVKVTSTASDAEDSGAATGWSIDDSGLRKDSGSSTWADSGGNSFRVAIYGRERDVVPPAFVGAGAGGSPPSGATGLRLYYDEALNTTAPPASAFTVRVNGANRGVSGVSVSGSVVTLTLAAGVVFGDSVTVRYTVPATNPLRDLEGNAAAALTNRAVDTWGPRFVSARVAGTALTATFDEPLGPESYVGATGMLKDDFQVTVDGGFGTSVTAATWTSGSPTVELTLDTAVVSAGQTVLVTYLSPAGGLGFKDRFGTFSPGFDSEPVTIVDTTAPAFSAATVDGTRLTLAYDEGLDETSVPAASAFDVTVGTAAAVNPSSVDVAGSTVVLTLATAVTTGQSVTLSYTVPGTNPIQDRADPANTAAALTGQTVTEKSSDTTLSALSAKKADDTALTLEPAFSSSTYAYVVTLDEGATSAKVTVTTSDTAATLSAFLDRSILSDATISITSGTEVELTGLGNGINVLTVTVTAEDGVAKQDYALTLRVLAPPAASLTPSDAVIIVRGDDLELEGSGLDPDGGEVTAEWTAEDSSGSPVPARVFRNIATIPGESRNTPRFTYFTATFNTTTPGTYTVLLTVTDDENKTTTRTLPVKVSDGIPPSFTGATVDGTALRLTYNEALDTNSVPARSAWTVKVGGGGGTHPSSVAVTGSVVTLTLATAVHFGPPVTVSYTVPAENPIQDPDGNDAAALTNRSVTVVDTRPPVLLGPSFDPPWNQQTYAEQNEVFMAFDEPLDEDSVPATSDFKVEQPPGSGTFFTVSSVDVVGSRVILTLVKALNTVNGGAGVDLYYAKGTNPIQDLAGNATTFTFDDRPFAIITTLPTLQTAVLNGARMTLTYDFHLNGENLDPSAYTVKVDGQKVRLKSTGTSVFITNGTLYIDLAAGVWSADRVVTVSYTVSDSNKLHTSLRRALSVTDFPVTVNDWTGPTLVPTTEQVPNPSARGTALWLTYNEILDTGSVPARTAYMVKVDGRTGVHPSSVAIADSRVTLTLASAVHLNSTVTVSYTVPAVNGTRVQDRRDNDAAGFSDRAVTILLSADARLGGLAVTDGGGGALELTPAFSSAGRVYEVSVGHAVTTVGVTATVNQEAATLSGSLRRDGGTAEEVTMTSGEAAELTDLAVGDNVLTITVTAEDDKTKRAYTLTVTRPPQPTAPPPPADATLSALVVADGSGSPLPLSPAFSSDTMAYEVEVDNAVTSVAVTATASDVFATLTGSLTRAGGTAEEVMVTSGVAAELTDLAEGDNVLEITVTPLVASLAEVYTLTVRRQSTGVSPGATLGALVGFAGEGRGYVRRGGDDER